MAIFEMITIASRSGAASPRPAASPNSQLAFIMAAKRSRRPAANSDEEPFELSASESDEQPQDEDSEADSDFAGSSDDDVVMTGASSSRGSGSVVPWVCPHCTYHNDVDSKTSSNVCDVCEAPRYDLSDDDFEDDISVPAPRAAAKKRQRKKSSEGAAKLPASRRRLGLADPMTQRPVEDEDETAEVDPADVANMTVKPPRPEAKAPKAVTMPLLPFQRESLGWMQAQEAGPIKGGILADEMGMGKTIQAITLIVANLPTGKAVAGSDKKASDTSSKEKGDSAGASVAPTAGAGEEEEDDDDDGSSDDFEDVEVVRTVTAAARAQAARMEAVDLEAQEEEEVPAASSTAGAAAAAAAADSAGGGPNVKEKVMDGTKPAASAAAAAAAAAPAAAAPARAAARTSGATLVRKHATFCAIHT